MRPRDKHDGRGRTRTHHQERLHLVLVPHRHLVDVHDRGVPARRDAAVRLDRLEDAPAPLAVPPVARQTERDEERLDGLWPVVIEDKREERWC